MEKLVIEGGDPLEGRMEVSGAKNAVLPIMAATLVTGSQYHINNVPDLDDVHTMCRLLEELGAEVTFRGSVLNVDTRDLTTTEASYDLVKQMRASFLVMGPLLSRTGEARVPLPGGCAIGTRPIDLHRRGMEDMGAEVEVEHGNVVARGTSLSGADIYLDFPSVGATENLMMAAVRADGTTVIENAAREPEIVCLAEMLNAMGARIEGAGTDRVVIEGAEDFDGAQHDVIPDRIEAGTFLIGGAITGGRVTVDAARPGHIQALLNKLRHAGFDLEVDERAVHIDARGIRPEPVDIVTMPYPGFPTDMQAQFMALMSLADGSCTVKETIFENRFMHVLELERFGADLKIDGNTVSVHGVEELNGAPVMATDLRASATLVLAGLAARGSTEVRRLYHLDRGYEGLDEKLRSLGATLDRAPAETP